MGTLLNVECAVGVSQTRVVVWITSAGRTGVVRLRINTQLAPLPFSWKRRMKSGCSSPSFSMYCFIAWVSSQLLV